MNINNNLVKDNKNYIFNKKKYDKYSIINNSNLTIGVIKELY